jgi:hypothetical protein
LMRCEQCGTENLAGSEFCRECSAPLGQAAEAAKATAAGGPETKPPGFARFLSTAWHRKGPILMALFILLMMAVVLAPWAFIKLDVFGISLVSRSFTGWQIYVGRVLFFLSIIPLIISVLLIFNIGTRRRVIETHVCTFLGGVIFTIWIIVFVMSEVLKALIKNVHVVSVSVAGGQVATIFLFIGFMLGIIITSYDRGRLLKYDKEGG